MQKVTYGKSRYIKIFRMITLDIKTVIADNSKQLISIDIDLDLKMEVIC